MRHLKVLHITMKITVVCDATASNIVEITDVSGRTSRLSLQRERHNKYYLSLNNGEGGCSEASVHFYQTKTSDLTRQ